MLSTDKILLVCESYSLVNSSKKCLVTMKMICYEKVPLTVVLQHLY